MSCLLVILKWDNLWLLRFYFQHFHCCHLCPQALHRFCCLLVAIVAVFLAAIWQAYPEYALKKKGSKNLLHHMIDTVKWLVLTYFKVYISIYKYKHYRLLNLIPIPFLILSFDYSAIHHHIQCVHIYRHNKF